MSKIIIVAGPVIVENNRVLLSQHGDDAFWKFCGGKAESDEVDLKAVARREIEEEMGLAIEILDQTPCFFYTEKEIGGIKTSVILVHFLARRLGDITPGPDIKQWGWLALDNLDKEKLAPNIKPALQYFSFLVGDD